MGGDNGFVKVLIEVVIVVGKDVVMVNKVLFVYYGQVIVVVVEEKGCVVCYEVVVVGGIFVIKVFIEGLVGNDIICVMGVMNGICNYILICMQDVGLFYEEVFVEVDVFGYFEVDLNLDVGGIDVGYKLVLLVFIVFGI